MPSAFVICPLKHPTSEERARSDFLLNEIVQPTLEGDSLAFDGVMRADLSASSTIINERIDTGVLSCDTLIADLTGFNPNVMYELGKRHGWGLPSIHFICGDPEFLPFDVKSHEAITYSWSADRRKISEAVNRQARKRLLTLVRSSLKSLATGGPLLDPRLLPPERFLTTATGLSLITDMHSGGRDHYRMARSAIESDPTEVFLSQRSSTLILGPEQDWSDEGTFYEQLLASVDRGADLYCVVSLEGIRRHQERGSIFPEMDDAIARLKTDKTGRVGIEGPRKTHWIKVEPTSDVLAEMKPDRQARALIVTEPSGGINAILVVDLGDLRETFQMAGPKARLFADHCRNYYNRCRHLMAQDLEALAAPRAG